jgi:hypothetical protein
MSSRGVLLLRLKKIELIINAPNAIRKDLALKPFSVGKFSAYSDSNSDHGISSPIFTQRLSADNLPPKGSSNSDGGLEASSAFLYMIAGGDARVLTYFTCLSCTLFSIARSKPFATQYGIDYSASPTTERKGIGTECWVKWVYQNCLIQVSLNRKSDQRHVFI